jgi:hypothetical protein
MYELYQGVTYFIDFYLKMNNEVYISNEQANILWDDSQTWEKVSRATEMENSMTYVLNRYLGMGDFTVGTMFTQPLTGNGRLHRLSFPVSLDEMWTNYPA